MNAKQNGKYSFRVIGWVNKNVAAFSLEQFPILVERLDLTFSSSDISPYPVHISKGLIGLGGVNDVLGVRVLVLMNNTTIAQHLSLVDFEIFNMFVDDTLRVLLINNFSDFDFLGNDLLYLRYFLLLRTLL